MPKPKGQFLFMNGAALTAGGEYGPFTLDGDHIIGVRGAMGGCTLTFFHKAQLGNDPETMGTLPIDPEMTFTALPPPFKYSLAESLPLYFSISNAGGGTSLHISAYKIGTTD